MNEFYIPANFEEGGKIMGVFGVRNIIEAGIISLPFIYLVFTFVPLGLTWKIILSATVVIPVGGFALIGINDDPVPSQQKWTQKSFKKRNESYSFFCFRKTAAFIPRFA